MSTKIYDAYEYSGNLHNLMGMLEQMRKALYGEAVKDLVKYYKASTPVVLDKFDTFGYEEALKKCLASSDYVQDHKDFGVLHNVSASAVVYAYRNRLFVQFFGLPRNYKIDNRKLRDFHYQNQTDTWYDHEEWEYKKKTGRSKGKAWYKKQAANYRERKRIWDYIIRNDGRPSHCGLVYEFIDKTCAMELSMDVRKKVKPVEAK